MKYETKSEEETQKLGFETAQEALVQFNGDEAVVFALYGDLGSGKTTFAQGIAAGLGIEEKVLSPTFVIMKMYDIPKTERAFYHIDCYRLKDSADLQELGWQEIVQNPQNIILLEWPERIQDILPDNKTSIIFQTINESQRQITIQN